MGLTLNPTRHKPGSKRCTENASTTATVRRDYTLVSSAPVHSGRETGRIPLRHIRCVGFTSQAHASGRFKSCLTPIGRSVNRLHTLHQRCGESSC